MARQKEQDLEQLKERILKMGGFVEDAIRKSIKALVERDRKLAIEVIDGEVPVTLHQSLDGFPDGVFNKPSHLEDTLFKLFEVLFFLPGH